MKPFRTWAVVDQDGRVQHLGVYEQTRSDVEQFVWHGEQLVRVEVRAVKAAPKKRGRP